jgi:hypothetical protein
LYHGTHARAPFFEGWYFKLVDPTEQYAFAIIPGIAYGPDGQAHAFVQVLDGKHNQSAYHRFPVTDFRTSDAPFEVRIGPNVFSREMITLDLPHLRGTVRLVSPVAWPWRPWSPGIMGWFSFVPFMECYHGIVSLDHTLAGSLTWQGQEIGFDGGKGYGEKDWGRSFPAAWIWGQTNHFDRPQTSLTVSIARIPWVGVDFNGFIVGFLLEGKLYRFATYTGARIRQVHADDQTVTVVLTRGALRLELHARRASGGYLAAPVLGVMEGRVNESMSSEVTVTLRRGKTLLYEGTGRHAGLEVGGNAEILFVKS